jgi:tetratricopeptide (TPR) repeat protein
MNAAESVDWVPALAALGVGLLLGAVLVWRVVRGSRPTAQAATGGVSAVEVRDLAGKRDALLRQLRELEDTASKRTPEQLARERYELELEAAGVLLALDKRGGSKARRPASASTSPSAGPASSAGAGRRGFLWGAGSASALLFLAFLVYQSAKPREAGGSVTGDVPMGSGGAGQPAGSDEAADPTEAQIQAALARNPDDIDAHLALARVYIGRRDMMSAWKETKQVLERAPRNAQALAYQALVRLAMGQPDVALDLIKKALASDPNLIDGYIYRALVYVRMGRMPDAEASIAEASKRFPERAAGLRRLLADLKKPEAATRTDAGSAAGEDPHAGAGSSGETGRAAPAAAAPTGRRVSGTVDIDPLLKSTVAPGAILFVFVREAGFGAGPPVAAKRLPARFPAAFEITEADAMMGQPFPDSLLIEARLDEDGDPTTRPPTDPKARLDDVKTGRTDVRLVLRRP